MRKILNTLVEFQQKRSEVLSRYNTRLEQDAVEKRQAIQELESLFSISNAVNTTDNSDDLSWSVSRSGIPASALPRKNRRTFLTASARPTGPPHENTGEMDGYEATRIIRRDEEKLADPGAGKTFRVPVIAMTAHAIKGYRERFILQSRGDGGNFKACTGGSIARYDLKN